MEKRRKRLIEIKTKFGLTNQEISQKLPRGMGSKKAVDAWTCGDRPVSFFVLDLLANKLWGEPILSKEEWDELSEAKRGDFRVPDGAQD